MSAAAKAVFEADSSKLDSALLRVQQSMLKLQKVVAMVHYGFTALKAVGNLISKEFEHGKESMTLGKELNELSVRTGIAVSDLVSLRDEFKKVGKDAEDIGPAIGGLQNPMNRADAAMKIFGRTGRRARAKAPSTKGTGNNSAAQEPEGDTHGPLPSRRSLADHAVAGGTTPGAIIVIVPVVTIVPVIIGPRVAVNIIPDNITVLVVAIGHVVPFVMPFTTGILVVGIGQNRMSNPKEECEKECVLDQFHKFRLIGCSKMPDAFPNRFIARASALASVRIGSKPPHQSIGKTTAGCDRYQGYFLVAVSGLRRRCPFGNRIRAPICPRGAVPYPAQEPRVDTDRGRARFSQTECFATQEWRRDSRSPA